MDLNHKYENFVDEITTQINQLLFNYDTKLDAINQQLNSAHLMLQSIGNQIDKSFIADIDDKFIKISQDINSLKQTTQDTNKMNKKINKTTKQLSTKLNYGY